MSQASLSKTERKYLAKIKEDGWVSVSSIDSLVWRKRQILDGLVLAGMIYKYRVSPSYDGYRELIK